MDATKRGPAAQHPAEQSPGPIGVDEGVMVARCIPFAESPHDLRCRAGFGHRPAVHVLMQPVDAVAGLLKDRGQLPPELRLELAPGRQPRVEMEEIRTQKDRSFPTEPPLPAGAPQRPTYVQET